MIKLIKKAVTNLIIMPVCEKAIILGAKWLSTEWKPSRLLVWSKGDAFSIPFISLLLVSIFVNESKIQNIYIYIKNML